MTISVVQTVFGTDSSASGSTATIIGVVFTAGNFAHLIVHHLQAASISSVVSTPSQVWTQLDDIFGISGSNTRVSHFVSDALVGGSTDITVNFSGSVGFRGIGVKEIGGCLGGYDNLASAHAGQAQLTPTTTTDAVTSGNTPALTRQPALVSAWSFSAVGSSTAAPAVGTGFTNDGAGLLIGSAGAHCRGESQRVTSTSAVAATYTAAANGLHITVAAVFLESAPPANAPLGYFDPELNIRAWF